MRRTSLAGLLASISQVVCAQPGDEAIARFKSCLQQEGAARLECFDKRLRELSEDNAPAAVNRAGEIGSLAKQHRRWTTVLKLPQRSSRPRRL